MELLGPEYSLAVDSLASAVKLFFSREVRGAAGEDLVEKQNAEVGSMPVVVDETAEYSYTDENRHMVRAFLRGETPDLTFHDGVEVVELLMTAYMSAEQGRTLGVPSRGARGVRPGRGAGGLASTGEVVTFDGGRPRDSSFMAAVPFPVF